MAVAVRGFVQGAQCSTGAVSLSWPAGTVAGDVALIHLGGTAGPTSSSGWTAVGHQAWYKMLTAVDVASPLTFAGSSHHKLQVFSGASAIGRTSSQSGLLTTAVGAGIWVDAARSVAPVATATYRLGVEWTDANNFAQGAYFIPNTDTDYDNISANSGAICYSYEVLPTAAPGAPTAMVPAAGARVDAATALTFSWRHQSPSAQTAVKVTVATGGVTKWLASDGTLSATEVSITTGVQSATLDAGQLAAGSTYLWTACTADGGGAGFGAFASAQTFYADAAPTVTSITVTSPAEDLSPSIAWAATAGYGSIVANQVLIAPAASSTPDVDAVWDSGVLAGTTSPVVASNTTEWTNGASLKAWVRVWQTGSVTKLTADDATFTVSWTPPATPTITATAGTPTTVTASGLTAGNLVAFESQVGSEGWQPLGTYTAATTSKSVAVPLPPTGASVTFRTRQGAVADGVPMQSAWATSSAITVTDATAYLVDDTDRSSYLAVEQDPGTDPQRVIVQGIATSYGLGATSARVDQAPPAGQVGSFILRADSETEAATIWAWLQARTVFWFRQAPDAYGAKSVQPVRVRRVSKLGSERLAESSGWRNLHVEWVEQPE